MAVLRLERDGLQDRFLRSRAKVQIYGGGFANGKTTAACIKALQLARDYPSSNGLVARETRPKLMDTIVKEFLKWCPPEWIKSFPRGPNSSNTCTLKNGTEINFRYVAQQKKGEQEGTSNLLSATYDWIIVDQMEDPGIVAKDFDDLLGRLRGNCAYRGDDPTMPATGPRWFIITCNPTRNWLYRTLVRPLHIYQETGRVHPDLLCLRDPHTNEPIPDSDGKPQLWIELFEGATHTNAVNLGADYVQMLESRYQGNMKERFLLGQWAAYSGLVYSGYDESLHSVSQERIEAYMWDLRSSGYALNWIEGYDYGIAVPSCYLAGFVDPRENVIIVDGFYKAEMTIAQQVNAINMVRERYGISQKSIPFADPQIFRRGPGGRDTVGKTVASMFDDEGIMMQRGNNNISNGIVKVQAHLNAFPMHRNPFGNEFGAPHFYHSDHLTFIGEEASEYVWKTDVKGELEDDKPVDKKDHAMDCIKYMLSHRPEPSVVVAPRGRMPSYMTNWSEAPDDVYNAQPHRH